MKQPFPHGLDSLPPEIDVVLASGEASPELRRTPRVSAFFDFIAEEIDGLRPMFTG